MDTNFTKCRISLDALDMNFLPITYSRNFNNVAPLWSYGLDRNEYFEFEIREKNDSNENHEAIETIKCHICNIEVPKVFINEHYKSKKHYINKRIADTALERIKQQLGDMKETDYVNNDDNVYFCPECVAIVQIKNRKSHEKQQSHKYSVMIDKLLADFHFIYANDNDEAKTDTIYDNDDTINESDFSEVETSVVPERSKADTDTVNDKNINHHNEANSGSTLDTDEPPKEIVKVHDNLKHDTENEFIIINTQDTTTTTKPNTSEESNYHVDSSSLVNAESEAKYLSVNGEVINCKICYSKFDKNSLNSHINGSRHKMNKISDVHYMMKTSGDELYCIVCLKSLPNTVESAKDHCSGTNHLSSYGKIIHENGISLKANTLYCEICNKNIPKRNEFIHIFDKTHHKRKTQMIENFYCSVCEKYIPNMDVNIHDNSIEHKTKIKNKKEDFINGDDKKLIAAKENSLLSNEGPDDIKKTPHFCTICQVNVPNGTNNIEIHYQGTRHKTKERKRADEILQNKQKHIEPSTSHCKENSNVSDVDYYTCDVCQVSLLNIDKFISEHNNGARHIKKLKQLQMQQTTEQVTIITQNQHEISSETESEATSQNSSKPNQQSKTPFQKPTTSNQKATTITQQHSTSTQQLTTTQKPSTSTQKHTSPIQHTTPVSHITEVAHQIMCEVCNVEVPNKTNNIKEHENGRLHQNNYKYILEEEEIVKKNNSYHCTICSRDIDNPLQHIAESLHQGLKRISNRLQKFVDKMIQSRI